MKLFRRINNWIAKPPWPPDPIGDLLFTANKALLVYFVGPALVLMAILAVVL